MIKFYSLSYIYLIIKFNYIMFFIGKIFFLIYFVFFTGFAFSNEINKTAQKIEKKEENNTKNKENTKKIKTVESVYDRPYSLLDNNIEWNLLGGGMLTMFGASLAAVGILYIMPESITNWDKDDAKDIFKKWKDNVSEGPVMDEDDWFLNWITHPYCGAVYYLAARSAGANIFYSFLYSTFLSTFFWEYGVESFAEVPSKQDLIITPVIGSLFGELFYVSKRHILENDGKLFNSRGFGKVTIFLMDPITEVTKLFVKPDNKIMEEHQVALYSFPIVDKHGGIGYGLNFSFKF